MSGTQNSPSDSEYSLIPNLLDGEEEEDEIPNLDSEPEAIEDDQPYSLASLFEVVAAGVNLSSSSQIGTMARGSSLTNPPPAQVPPSGPTNPPVSSNTQQSTTTSESQPTMSTATNTTQPTTTATVAPTLQRQVQQQQVRWTAVLL
jgi:hypothetical protein